MKTNTKNSIRMAYEAPEATCMELLYESCITTVSTDRYGNNDDSDNWTEE